MEVRGLEAVCYSLSKGLETGAKGYDEGISKGVSLLKVRAWDGWKNYPSI